MSILICQIFLGAADIALVVAGRRLRLAGPVSVGRAMLLCGATLLAHTAAAIPLAQVCIPDPYFGRFLFLFLYFFSGVVPAILCVRILIDAISAAASNMVFGMDTVRPLPHDSGEAEALAAGGDIHAAEATCREAYADAPDDPGPLFALAGLFERNGATQEAADVLDEIMSRHRANATQWAKAAYFLSELRAGPLADPQAACFLLDQIVLRAPKTTYAEFARKKLKGMRKHSLN